ncbi:hypothetical protein [Pseudoalteromonas sp. OANN1]|uniref:GTP pyrophosphokinase n=1 Tax=Pseudoalteromonas sp. OANN1 TaxID=2954497 RepID=UPI002096D7AD|nr:hypothetical protein [Pseudoalteromonas sp. OANN1]MCO7201887.1 hypothetical protein [Pseudoalteromonas sp. OANN1]
MNNQIEKYRKLYVTYGSYAKRLEGLLCDLLAGSNIRVHFTESRAKTPESLKEKINRPGKSYVNVLEEVPDLVGVRLVLYYQDDSIAVQDLIADEFEVMEVEKSHQPDKYSPDKFGYISTHFVIRINRARAKLTEWKAYKDLHAEVQVRTVLQHSWAAISHALQYKREGDVPAALRRKLFRLAGLFELADEQFIEIRNEASFLKKNAPNIVEENSDDTRVDSIILRELLMESKLFIKIVETMNDIGFKVGADWDDEENYIGKCVEELERFNVANLGFVNSLLRKNHKKFLEAIFHEDPSDGDWPIDKSFAFYLLLINEFSEEITIDYLTEELKWWDERAENVISNSRKLKAI